ncbi:MFS transporter [Aneurinibacillus aneurinilyticus]|uniref:MFS transporter n=1 Tax=Aneurinibacillus aneurinilyticus TaxID=1391 RepID=UPI0035238CA4
MMSKWLLLLFFTMFIIGTDSFLIAPLLPTLQAEFDVATDISGWMVGAYALGYAVFAVIAGPLSDGWDRKKVLVYGMLGFAVTTALCGLATGFWSMFAFRFLAGVSAAFCGPQVWAIAGQLSQPKHVVRSMGVVTAGLGVSQVLGVPVGSALAAISWPVPFFVIGGAALFLAVLQVVSLPGMPPAALTGGARDESVRTARRSALRITMGYYRTVLRDSRSRWAFSGYFAFQLGNYAGMAFMGTWLTERFGFGVTEVGYAVLFAGIGNLIGSMSSSEMVKCFGSGRLLITVLVMMAFLYGGIAFSPQAWIAEAAYGLIFMLAGLMIPLMIGRLTGLHEGMRGTLSSLTSAVMYASTTVGSWIAGVLYVRLDGYAAVGAFVALSYITAMGIFVVSGVMAGGASSNVLSRKVSKASLKEFR